MLVDQELRHREHSLRRSDVFTRVETVIQNTPKDVNRIHRNNKVPPCIGTTMLGIGRVADALKLRGLYP